MADAFTARFSLFVNNQRRSEKSPSQTGSVEILASEVPALIQWLQSATQEDDYKGNPIVKLRIAAWDAESRSGNQYLNGTITPPLPPQDRPAAAAPATSYGGAGFAETDDIPF